MFWDEGGAILSAPRSAWGVSQAGKRPGLSVLPLTWRGALLSYAVIGQRRPGRRSWRTTTSRRPWATAPGPGPTPTPGDGRCAWCRSTRSLRGEARRQRCIVARRTSSVAGRLALPHRRITSVAMHDHDGTCIDCSCPGPALGCSRGERTTRLRNGTPPGRRPSAPVPRCRLRGSLRAWPRGPASVLPRPAGTVSRRSARAAARAVAPTVSAEAPKPAPPPRSSTACAVSPEHP